MDLNTPIEKLYMVGPTYAKRLKKLDITKVEDLISHYPFRYEDYSIISQICLVQPGEKVTVQGEVLSMKNEYTKHGKKIQKAVVADQTGKIDIVWFNQPFLVKNIHAGDETSLSGKIDWFGSKVVLVSPEYEIIKKPATSHKLQATIHTGRLVPVYPETKGLSSKWLRSRIAPLLTQCSKYLLEFLPDTIITQHNLLNFREAVCQIHFPENKIIAKKARERLAFDELFLIQLASLKRKAEWKKEVVGNILKISKFKNQISKFLQSLPFALTKAQRRCVGEILTDLGTSQPMNRLLQGEVGSGKTVVAAVAMYVAKLNGFQSILMAPTEILAFQHYETIKEMLVPFGMKIALKTRSRKEGLENSKVKEEALIGTHALLSENLKFSRVGLVVIDEQHRFGVEQRAILRSKGINPHLLTMTATPIPRTVALTLYGELDLSFIDEMPEGRKVVKTWVVPLKKREAAYQWIRKKIKGDTDPFQHQQAFIICPLIEESPVETMQSVKAATVEFERLKEKVFPELNLGLLHGRVKSKEKEETLGRFRQGKIDILVATPVVEVGIDIPKATIMMIEGADRFGLAQLHQLRGRVGRGTLPSFCLLFTESTCQKVLKRLRAMEKMHIGAELAELDLKLRGPGEIYGTQQHGFVNLKVASMTDFELIEKTRVAAQKLIKESPTLSGFPLLQEKLKRHTIKKVTPD